MTVAKLKPGDLVRRETNPSQWAYAVVESVEAKAVVHVLELGARAGGPPVARTIPRAAILEIERDGHKRRAWYRLILGIEP